MATLALTDIEATTLNIAAVDAAGNPTVLPSGAVTWSSSAPDIVSVAPTAEGMACDIAAVGPLGAARITVAVQVDPATTLTGALDVTVSASAAASISIQPAEPHTK